MKAGVRARYANGVLTPLEPLDLEEGAEVTVSLQDAAGEASAPKQESANPTIDGNVVSRGKSIYDRKIRRDVEESSQGKFAVIDVNTEDYEIDPIHAVASRRLAERHPDAVTYTVRIGSRTTYRAGLRARGLSL